MNTYFKKEGHKQSGLLWAIQIFLLILIIIGVVLLSTQKLWLPGLVEYIIERENMEMAPVVAEPQTPSAPAVRPDVFAKNTTYTIEGTAVTLKDGDAFSLAVPGSASEITTGYFGNEVFADINADGKEDVVFLLTQETGGSGLFFYVAAAVSEGTGYKGSQAFFLGDRIAPQTTEFRDGVVVVNFADRAEGEPFSVPPSVGKSTRLTFDTKTMVFSEIPQY